VSCKKCQQNPLHLPSTSSFINTLAKESEITKSQTELAVEQMRQQRLFKPVFEKVDYRQLEVCSHVAFCSRVLAGD